MHAYQWREERAALLQNAKNIVAKAKTGDRDLTTSEQDQLTDLMGQVERLDARAKGSALVNSVLRLSTAEDDLDQPNSLFTETAAKDLVTAVKTRSTYRTEVSAKAALTTTVLPTMGKDVAPGLYPNAAFPLSTLFPNREAGGPSVRYYRLGDATADLVPEGGLKPDSGVTIDPQDAVIEKIATLVHFSDEFADDAPFLLGYLQAELVSAVITKENAEILAACNAASGVLTSTGAATTVIDLIADAIAGQEAINGSTPTAVVVNPTVLATIRKAKANTGGDYFVDPLTATPTTIHGVRVLSTPATAASTAWVVNGAGVVIYRRGGITAEIGTSADDFMHNMRTMRVEERFATAVVRPSMLTKATLT